MDQDKIRSLFNKQVVPFLNYRVGGQLAALIGDHVLNQDVSGIIDERVVFQHFLHSTASFSIDGHAVLPLVFDSSELENFEEKFLNIFDDTQKVGGASSFDTIFDNLVAGYLEDILGKELVDTVKKVFMKAVLAIPDQPVEVRFYIGMQAVYHFIPDVWSEIEFAEKVKNLSRLLPKDDVADTGDEAGNVDFESLMEAIIVSDLAEILGKGHALETVINSAQEKISGIFYNEQDRFTTFVNKVLEDDFIIRMFDSYWIEERRNKWVEEAKLMSEV